MRDEEYEFFSETNYVSADNVVETRRPWEPFFDESPSSIQLVVDLVCPRCLPPFEVLILTAHVILHKENEG